MFLQHATHLFRAVAVNVASRCHRDGPPGSPRRYIQRVARMFAAVALMAMAGASVAQTCTYSLAATSANAPAAGGSGSFDVNATSGCGWTATSNASWLHVTSGVNGSGNGSVGFSVDANTGGQRIGALSIAGLTFTVVQNAAAASTPLSLGPNASYTLGAGQVTLHVDSIRNNRSGTSGAMRLELWALDAPYSGSNSGTVLGHRLAVTSPLNPLPSNATYTNITQTVSFTAPPPGTWYLALFLTENTGAAVNDGFALSDYFNFSTTLVVPAGPNVVEFYNTLLDNYFITASAAEQAAIDGGSAGPGWIRTGLTFKSGGNAQVCRFYGSMSPGPNSHFYTINLDECQGLLNQQFAANDPRRATVKSWNFESLDFVSTAPVNQSCPAGTVPVYRAYNNGFARNVDSNHRITTSAAAIQEVVKRGWTSEGVVMCAPA